MVAIRYASRASPLASSVVGQCAIPERLVFLVSTRHITFLIILHMKLLVSFKLPLSRNYASKSPLGNSGSWSSMALASTLNWSDSRMIDLEGIGELERERDITGAPKPL